MDHAEKYFRMPTRVKIQFLWGFVLTCGICYNLVQLAVLRIQPKREEVLYNVWKENVGDNVPAETVQQMQRYREMIDTYSLTNVLRAPTPGEVSGALAHEFDPRTVAKLRSRNGL
jgi:hypothetical protein